MIVPDVAGSGERGGGAVSAPMAIATLALLAAIGLGIDGARAAQGLATADAVAEEAARAAGQALDLAALQRGIPVVDTTAALTTARQFLADAGVDGSVQLIAPDRIRVRTRLTRPTVLLGLLGRPEITSSGEADAVIVAVLPPGGGP